MTLESAFLIKEEMSDSLNLILINKGRHGSDVDDTLDRIANDIWALRELSGEVEDVQNTLTLLTAELRELVAFKFPFEPADTQP